MSHTVAIAAVALGIGVVAGLRSMIAPAAAAIADRASVLAALLVLAAVGESIVDKLPRTPSRLLPPTLLWRCIAGAASAFFLAGGPLAAALGLVGALAGSYGGAAFRRRFPGFGPALLEDCLAVGLAVLAVRWR